MQDQYAGDIGDYFKLSLLEELLKAPGPGRRLGVAWWKVANEADRNDGRHIDYLKRRKEWRDYNPALFDHLKTQVDRRVRSISMLERAPGFRPATGLEQVQFFDELVPCPDDWSARVAAREAWLTDAETKLGGCNIVFFDPDNGIAPPQRKMTQRAALKSVFIEELLRFRQPGRTLVVYHHQTRMRGGHEAEIRHLTGRLRREGFSDILPLRFNRGTARVFFILDGDAAISTAAREMADRWSTHMGMPSLRRPRAAKAVISAARYPTAAQSGRPSLRAGETAGAATGDIFRFWAGLKPGTKVHPLDAEVLGRVEHGFDLDCLPFPFLGPLKTAPVVLLYLNPSLGGDDHEVAGSATSQKWFHRALDGMHPLPDTAQTAAAAKWCQKQVKLLGDWERMRHHVAILELTPYHCSRFENADPKLLPALASSRAAAAWAQEVLFPDARDGRRVVICVWGARSWGLAAGRQYGEKLFALADIRGGLRNAADPVSRSAIAAAKSMLSMHAGENG